MCITDTPTKVYMWNKKFGSSVAYSEYINLYKILKILLGYINFEKIEKVKVER